MKRNSGEKKLPLGGAGSFHGKEKEKKDKENEKMSKGNKILVLVFCCCVLCCVLIPLWTPYLFFVEQLDGRHFAFEYTKDSVVPVSFEEAVKTIKPSLNEPPVIPSPLSEGKGKSKGPIYSR